MPVERVELEHRHLIEHPQDDFFPKEMAGFVDLQPAIPVMGLVRDQKPVDNGFSLGFGRLHQNHFQRDRTVKRAALVRCAHGDPVGCNAQHIAFLRHTRDLFKGDRTLALSGVRFQIRGQIVTRACKFFGAKHLGT